MLLNKITYYKALYILLTLFTLVSCGGSANNMAGGGVGGTGISVGKITKFGSVFVNGVEFFTSKETSITSEGKEAAENDLGKGMIVTVTGTFNADGKTGTATKIEFKNNLEGPVENIDPINQTLVVLGQQVKVDKETNFFKTTTTKEPDATGTIPVWISKGNIIEVSGFLVDKNGGIHATYIKLKALDLTQVTEIEVKGFISNLNRDTNTFMIGPLTVNFSNLKPEDVPVEGSFVEVTSNKGIENGELIANKVELEQHSLISAENEKVKAGGIVTNVSRLVSYSEFEINDGQVVRIITNTKCENCKTPDIASNIILDTKLEIEGTVDANGVLVAEGISFENNDGGEEKSIAGASNPSSINESVVNNNIVPVAEDKPGDTKDEKDGGTDGKEN